MKLTLKDISIGYSAPVVTSIDAELNSGDFVCLVGRNGTGKSTLLKTIAGLQPPLQGQILVNGASFSRAHLPHIGIVLTQAPQLNNTTVFELVSYGRIQHQNLFASLSAEDIGAIEEAISTVGIQDLKDRKLDQLSDGEKQKAMIARALAQGTDVLLLDEPSAFLDYISRRELMHLLRVLAHQENKIILLSTHDIDLVNSFADVSWIISDHELRVSNSVLQFSQLT